MNTVSIKAYAKINLFLDVLGIREDNFHSIATVAQNIDFYDLVEVSLSDETDQIEISTDSRHVPDGPDNIAYQAALAVKNKFEKKDGIIIDISKKIPVAAGLGGGSTDAAAVISGLNRLWKLELTREEMAEIGSKIGADIPLFLYGGTILAKGKGDEVSELKKLKKFQIVMAKPSISVSTGYVYQQYDLLDKKSPVSVSNFLNYVKKGSFKGISEHLFNALERVTVWKYPAVKELKEVALKNGASGALMTGSGATVFAMVKSDKIQKEVAHALKRICPLVVPTTLWPEGLSFQNHE